MADQNTHPYYPDGTKNPAQSWNSSGSGAPPQMGYAPGQPQYGQQPYAQGPMIIPVAFQNTDVSQIRDWLPWSIVNFFIGWVLGGILPLIFSLICRSNKQANNAQGARTMSTLALVFNILVTIGGLISWIYFIVAMVFLASICSGYGCT